MKSPNTNTSTDLGYEEQFWKVARLSKGWIDTDTNTNTKANTNTKYPFAKLPDLKRAGLRPGRAEGGRRGQRGSRPCRCGGS